MKKIFTFILFLCTYPITPHGFGEETLIPTAGDNTRFAIIKHIAQLTAQGKKHYVESIIDIRSKNNIIWTKRRATAAGFSTTNCYYSISFKEPNSQPILCTPTQLFYHARYRAWGPAYIFKVGDQLLCGTGAKIEISDITFIEKPLKVYTLEVEETHIYSILSYKVQSL